MKDKRGIWIILVLIIITLIIGFWIFSTVEFDNTPQTDSAQYYEEFTFD